jgi:hypothetical protein
MNRLIGLHPCFGDGNAGSPEFALVGQRFVGITVRKAKGMPAIGTLMKVP